MSIDQVDYWLSTIIEESSLKFFYKIVENKKEKSYDIYFDFLDLTKMQILFILYWVRYTYHYPDSLCALDAIILKQNYFPDEYLYNLLTLTANCQVYNNSLRINRYDCITVNGNFIKRGELIWRLYAGHRSIPGIFGNAYCDTDYYRSCCLYRKYTKKNIPVIYSEPKRISTSYYYSSPTNNKNWFTPELWVKNEKRFDFYVNAYPVYKEHEIDL